MDVLLVDDEALSRKRLRQMLGQYADCTIVGECESGASAVEQIRSLAPDLVFLDVQMPEMSGLDVLAEVDPEYRPLIIFVTAHDDYALRAFEVHAVDYLLKPFDRNRFRAAYEHARVIHANRAASRERGKLASLLEQLDRPAAPAAPVQAATLPERLLVKAGSRVLFLNTYEIDWIEAAGNYVKLHVAGDDYIVRESIAKLEELLCQQRFARVHRSTIVNLDRVRELRPWFSGEMIVVMRDGTELKLSRTYRKDLERRVRILA